MAGDHQNLHVVAVGKVSAAIPKLILDQIAIPSVCVFVPEPTRMPVVDLVDEFLRLVVAVTQVPRVTTASAVLLDGLGADIQGLTESILCGKHQEQD